MIYVAQIIIFTLSELGEGPLTVAPYTYVHHYNIYLAIMCCINVPPTAYDVLYTGIMRAHDITTHVM